MPEPQHESDGTAAAIHGGRTGDSHGLSSGSVSESSGSIVGDRMFERSAPAAPGAGLDRAWLAGRAAHQALVYGKGIAGGNGHGNGDDGDVGGGWLGDVAGAGRRGYRAADQMRLLDNIARGRYTADEVLVGEQGRSFISQVCRPACFNDSIRLRCFESSAVHFGKSLLFSRVKAFPSFVVRRCLISPTTPKTQWQTVLPTSTPIIYAK